MRKRIHRGRFFEIASCGIETGVMPGANDAFVAQNSIGQWRTIMSAVSASRVVSTLDPRQQNICLIGRDLFHFSVFQVINISDRSFFVTHDLLPIEVELLYKAYGKTSVYLQL